jgi:hypothetical protein
VQYGLLPRTARRKVNTFDWPIESIVRVFRVHHAPSQMRHLAWHLSMHRVLVMDMASSCMACMDIASATTKTANMRRA